VGAAAVNGSGDTRGGGSDSNIEVATEIVEQLIPSLSPLTDASIIGENVASKDVEADIRVVVANGISTLTEYDENNLVRATSVGFADHTADPTSNRDEVDLIGLTAATEVEVEVGADPEAADGSLTRRSSFDGASILFNMTDESTVGEGCKQASKIPRIDSYVSNGALSSSAVPASTSVLSLPTASSTTSGATSGTTSSTPAARCVDINLALKWLKLASELLSLPEGLIQRDAVEQLEGLLRDAGRFFEVHLGPNDERWSEFLDIQKVSPNGTS
jgi:hypothetical protein